MTSTAIKTCPICEALCGLEIDHAGGVVQAIRGQQADVLSKGHLCAKAQALKDMHEDPDRLRQPVRRVGDRWEPISWKDALDECATRLHDIRSKYGRRASAIYLGNPNAHNYATLLSTPLLQAELGTPNRYSATSVDQLPHMFAALHMFGHQLMLPIPDIDHCDFMVIAGGNPVVSNGSIMTAPGMGRRIKAIKERGGRVLVIDPRRTRTARVAGEHMFVRPGSDPLLFSAILQVIFAEELDDQGAWRNYTDGIEELRACVERFTPQAVETACGIAANDIQRLARDFAKAPSAAFYGRLGVTTQPFGGLAATLLYALNIVTGNLDKRGGMMFTNPAVDLLSVSARMGQKGHFGRRKSRVGGLPEFGGEMPVAALAEEIETPGEGQIRALVVQAGNPVLSTPQGQRLAAAIETLDFVVALDPWITATSRHAHIILPPLSHLERDHYGLIFQAFGVRDTVKYSKPLFAPPKGALDDWQILFGLAQRIARLRGGLRGRLRALQLRAMVAIGPRRLLDILLRLGPAGRFSKGKNRYKRKLTLARVSKAPGGVDLGPLQPCLPERLFTEDKRINLAPADILADAERLAATWLDSKQSIDDDQLLLIGRRQTKSNNTWLHNSARLQRGPSRCTLLMHPSDANRLDLAAGSRVSIRSEVGQVQVELAIDEDIMRGVVSLPHGWGHKAKGAELRVANAVDDASMNDLLGLDFYDRLTGTSVLSGIPVRVESVVTPAPSP